MNSVEILDKKSSLKEEIRSLINTAKAETRELTEEEQNRVDEIKKQIEALNKELEEIEKKNEVPTDENKEENKRNKTMKNDFSILKAIRSVVDNQPLDVASKAFIEAGREEMRNLNAEGQIQIPVETRTINITNTTTGEHNDIVSTDMMNVLEPLQHKLALVEAGARMVTGLVGDVQYPVMGNGAAAWEGENTEADDAGITFSNVKLQPKRLSTTVAISKQLLVQDSVGAENAIRNEIINAIAQKLENTVLGSAAASATQPAGIFNGQSATFTTFADLCGIEADVENAKFIGEKAYIVSPSAKATLRGMIKGTNGTGMVWENGEIDGTKAISTGNVTGNKVAYGQFDQLVIGQWGALDIVVDPYTRAKFAEVVLTVNAWFDAKLLRAGAVKCATYSAPSA